VTTDRAALASRWRRLEYFTIGWNSLGCPIAATMRTALLGLLMFASPTLADAQSSNPTSESPEHAVIYELGWVGEWSRDEGFNAKGATFAFEVTPIERWLELEIGVAALRAKTSTEIPVDVLFKKPWQISSTVEFMAGAGPELIHTTGVGRGTSWGFSAVADFMFWPKPNVGWYVEPGYEAVFRQAKTEHGLGIAAGLLIGR